MKFQSFEEVIKTIGMINKRIYGIDPYEGLAEKDEQPPLPPPTEEEIDGMYAEENEDHDCHADMPDGHCDHKSHEPQ